jgi:hypothetical protein
MREIFDLILPLLSVMRNPISQTSFWSRVLGSERSVRVFEPSSMMLTAHI